MDQFWVNACKGIYPVTKMAESELPEDNQSDENALKLYPHHRDVTTTDSIFGREPEPYFPVRKRYGGPRLQTTNAVHTRCQVLTGTNTSECIPYLLSNKL